MLAAVAAEGARSALVLARGSRGEVGSERWWGGARPCRWPRRPKKLPCRGGGDSKPGKDSGEAHSGGEPALALELSELVRRGGAGVGLAVRVVDIRVGGIAACLVVGRLRLDMGSLVISRGVDCCGPCGSG